MKKNLRITGIVIAGIVVAFTILNLSVSRSIKTEIIIDSSAEDAWNVLMDHQAYPDWNPFIKQISGTVQPGQNLNITVQSEGNDPMSFTPEVLVNAVNKEFRWVGKLGMKGIVDGEHYFIMEPTEGGAIKFIHGENFTGILSGLFSVLVMEDTIKGFKAMNDAFKKRVEQS